MELAEDSSPAGGDSPDGMSAFAADVLARQPFRGYELKTALASGDRTAVFKAHDKTMERTVAIKVLRPAPGREGAVEDFFSLAGSIARLRCPGVPRGLDAGRGDGDFFLVYEFVRGECLRDRLARLQAGKLSDRDALKTIWETTSVLQRLFERGHPHGRLKPSNLIQTDGGGVRLADIGFAWNLAWKDDDEAFLANPGYLSPEQIEGEFNVDIRGDLYALGAIWFESLVGRPVFERPSPGEILEAHRTAKPEKPHRIDEKISETTSNLVGWLLEKDRDNRPRTPREFLRRLAAHPLLAGEEGGAFRLDGAERGEGECREGILAVADEVEALIRAGSADAGAEGHSPAPDKDGEETTA